MPNVQNQILNNKSGEATTLATFVDMQQSERGMGVAMTKIRMDDIKLLCDELLNQKHFEQVAQLLEQVLPSIQSHSDCSMLLEVLQNIPEPVRIESSGVASIYVKALALNQLPTELLAFSDLVITIHGNSTASGVRLERAGALLSLSRYLEAKETLEQILPLLERERLGIAWMRLGLCFFYLGEAWMIAFQQARGLLKGADLGRSLLNEAYCLAESHRGFEARNVWLEALPLFQSTPNMLAWTRYNLGISALRDLEYGAERHFLEARRLTKNPQFALMRALVLNGLAASRRVLGEWTRAEATYREALLVARDSHDREDSFTGLARTLRLAGRVSDALETLEFALHDQTINHDLVQVSRATVFLAMGQNQSAREALSHVGQLVSTSDQWLEKIARAELARRDGQIQTAVEVLEGLPVNTLHAREEAKCFPELMQLLAAANKPMPKPLEYIKGVTVSVVAQGVLSVRVNDRPIPIAPTGRAGELLVYLLEQNGTATVDMMIDALFSSVGIPNRKNARGLIWRWVKTLRQAFGWESSVMSLRAAYQLDPNVTWQYDIKEARASRSFQGEFLKGVYSDWAIEVGRSLEGHARLKRRSSDLN
jgi:tetratricopeptide (TPR) repeat protein